MTDDVKPLGNLPELTSLTPEETEAVAALGETREYEPDQVIYSQGEPGGKLYAIEAGAVALGVILADGVEKHHVTLPAGTVFGTLAFADLGLQAATARATENARIVEIDRAEFDSFCGAHPATAVKLFRYLFETVAAQTRLTVDKYLRTIEWNLQITAAADLNLRRLVSDEAELRLALVNGGEARGTLLQFDSSPAGYELLLRSSQGELLIIPYHAVAQLSLAAKDWSDAPEAGDPVA